MARVKSRSKTKASSSKREGLGRVREAASRKSGGDWLKVADGESVVLRVLDTGEDFTDAYVHRVPMEGQTKSYYADIPCLDQDNKGIKCPGCRDELALRYKFWANVIVRDWEGEDGNQKPKDTLMLWGQGITVAKRLDKLDSKRGTGLKQRDIEVEREGSTKNDTVYHIDWADEENVPLSENDKKLAAKKFDLTRYSKPPSFDDFYVPPSERNKDDDDVGEKSRKRGSAFKRARDEEDDEDEKPAKRTRRSAKSNPLKASTKKKKPSAKVRTRRSSR